MGGRGEGRSAERDGGVKERGRERARTRAGWGLRGGNANGSLISGRSGLQVVPACRPSRRSRVRLGAARRRLDSASVSGGAPEQLVSLSLCLPLTALGK